MHIVSSTEARNNLSAMLAIAQHEPVLIQKQGRDEGVLISRKEYERLSNMAAHEFMKAADEAGRYAASKGMTEEVLAKLLVQDDKDGE